VDVCGGGGWRYVMKLSANKAERVDETFGEYLCTIHRDMLETH
jgi:hypothetical protein